MLPHPTSTRWVPSIDTPLSCLARSLPRPILFIGVLLLLLRLLLLLLRLLRLLIVLLRVSLLSFILFLVLPLALSALPFVFLVVLHLVLFFFSQLSQRCRQSPLGLKRLNIAAWLHAAAAKNIAAAADV
jgi:hypothetical protein